MLLNLTPLLALLAPLCPGTLQGGICAVLDAADSVEAHVRDTLVAGAHLNDRNAVEVVCREGPRHVLELARLGAEFTRNASGDGGGGAGGGLHLTREGGHSARRIVHAADATGAEIERALVAAAAAHPAIAFFQHHLAVDLLSEWRLGGQCRARTCSDAAAGLRSAAAALWR